MEIIMGLSGPEHFLLIVSGMGLVMLALLFFIAHKTQNQREGE